jgi:hypothetical protein
MPVEFDCSDCGTHIIAIVEDKPPYGALCALCLHLPGWFSNPQLVAIYGPERLTKTINQTEGKPT